MLGFAEQLGGCDVERVADGPDLVHADRGLAAFDPSHVGAVDSGQLAQSFLRDASDLAHVVDGLSQQSPAFLRHAAYSPLSRTIKPRLISRINLRVPRRRGRLPYGRENAV